MSTKKFMAVAGLATVSLGMCLNGVAFADTADDTMGSFATFGEAQLALKTTSCGGNSTAKVETEWEKNDAGEDAIVYKVKCPASPTPDLGTDEDRATGEQFRPNPNTTMAPGQGSAGNAKHGPYATLDEALAAFPGSNPLFENGAYWVFSKNNPKQKFTYDTLGEYKDAHGNDSVPLAEQDENGKLTYSTWDNKAKIKCEYGSLEDAKDAYPNNNPLFEDGKYIVWSYALPKHTYTFSSFEAARDAFPGLDPRAHQGTYIVVTNAVPEGAKFAPTCAKFPVAGEVSAKADPENDAPKKVEVDSKPVKLDKVTTDGKLATTGATLGAAGALALLLGGLGVSGVRLSRKH